jgi:hypothetical protein
MAAVPIATSPCAQDPRDSFLAALPVRWRAAGVAAAIPIQGDRVSHVLDSWPPVRSVRLMRS